MKDWRSQAHVKWECKYHVVILPKYRRRVIYGRVRREIGRTLRDLCRQKEIGLEEGHALPDHIHMLLSVPPKYSIAHTIGFLKGKSAIRWTGGEIDRRAQRQPSESVPIPLDSRCFRRTAGWMSLETRWSTGLGDGPQGRRSMSKS